MTGVYSEVDGLSMQNLFFAKNGYFPSCYMFTDCSEHYDFKFNIEGILNELIEKYKDMQYIQYTNRNMSDGSEKDGLCILLKDNLCLRLESNINESYILYSNKEKEELKSLVELLTKYYVAPEPEKNNLWKIAENMGGLYLKKSKIKIVPDFSIERQYNDSLIHEDEKIRNFINTDGKAGLVLLHGEKGTGKTFYIRNLINSFPEKKFVFISPDMMPALGTPSFIDFLSTLNNHIIILEDCENVIRDRKSTGATAAVSTLLNMSDGLLSDDLNMKFICTFNEDIKDIDSALLRKGRLICKYEFKPLSVEKTNALLDYLYANKVDNTEVPHVDKGLSLADIYNYEDDSYEPLKKKII